MAIFFPFPSENVKVASIRNLHALICILEGGEGEEGGEGGGGGEEEGGGGEGDAELICKYPALLRMIGIVS